MCNYQGYEFGARYPDSLCIDGQLYNADDCDGEGNLYDPMEYWPCPMCHPFRYIQRRAQYNDGGFYSWYSAIRLTLNIIKNRVFKTEPWRTP